MEGQDDSTPDAEHRADVLQQQQAIRDAGSSCSLTAALRNAPKHRRSPAACRHYCITAADLESMQAPTCGWRTTLKGKPVHQGTL